MRSLAPLRRGSRSSAWRRRCRSFGVQPPPAPISSNRPGAGPRRWTVAAARLPGPSGQHIRAAGAGSFRILLSPPSPLEWNHFHPSFLISAQSIDRIVTPHKPSAGHSTVPELLGTSMTSNGFGVIITEVSRRRNSAIYSPTGSNKDADGARFGKNSTSAPATRLPD